ncbi:hypothetical protein ABEY61_16480 [Bacillus toyonensis]|uniref:hypothetical protein n=1 Tax=Bacillus toyonensis TaxID=155322 RepID=UPI003D21EDB7
MIKGKFNKFILSGAMVFVIALPIGQVSADTLEKTAINSNVDSFDEEAINWTFQKRYGSWEDGFYVERTTYVAYPYGRLAMKLETATYTDKSKTKRVHYSAMRYWL